jgi:hypothetical protein
VFNLTGINQLSLSNLIQIYPNPNSGNFSIQFKNTIVRDELEILNTVGQVVYSESISNAKSIDVQLDLPKGLYFIRLKDNQPSEFLKLVIQ